jgi:hypothetical protein
MTDTNFLLLMILLVLAGRGAPREPWGWPFSYTGPARPPKPLFDRLLLLMPFVGLGLVTLIVLSKATH